MKISPYVTSIKTGLKTCWQTIKSYSVGDFDNYGAFLRKSIPSADIFCKKDYPQLILENPDRPGYTYIYKKIFRETNSFTNENYERLTNKELSAIRANISVTTAQNANSIVNSAKLVKEIFDKKFGKNNYVFISIGRSYATMAKALEYMGIESKCIPFSRASFVEEENQIQHLIHQKGFNKYQKYLYSQGLSPDQVNKSQKYYLFCDYAMTGNSLHTFKKIVTSKEVGLDNQNLRFIKLNRMLSTVFETMPNINYRIDEELMDMEWKLATQAYDDYAEIKQLDCNNLNNIERAVNQPLDEIVKKMQFCILDILHINK